MIRATSLETYYRIRDEGLLSRLRFEVYDVVYHSGPMTEGECWKFFFSNDRQRCSITPRFSELERMGVIAIVGERPCRFTGNNAQVWQTTDSLPAKVAVEKKVECPTCHGSGRVSPPEREDLFSRDRESRTFTLEKDTSGSTVGRCLRCGFLHGYLEPC